MAFRLASLASVILVLAVLSLLAPEFGEGIEVTFTIQKKVAYGRGLRVAGNTTSLGSWEPASAAQLEVNTTTEKDWQATVTVSGDVGLRVEFKPLITDYGTGDNAVWLQGDNLVFQIPEADAIVVPIIWTADASLPLLKQVVH